MVADRYYDVYQALNRLYLGVDWGVRATRHAMIAIAREHLMPNESFTAVQRALADSSDHSVETEQGHYAIKHGDAPRISNLIIWRSRWVIQEWWKVLALTGEPLRPLCERQVFQEDDLTTRVTRTVDSAVEAALPGALTASLDRAMPQFLNSITQLLSTLAPRSVPGMYFVVMFHRSPSLTSPFYSLTTAIVPAVFADRPSVYLPAGLILG